MRNTTTNGELDFRSEALRLTGYCLSDSDTAEGRQTKRNSGPIEEAERIASLVSEHTPESTKVYGEYCRLLNRAVKEGQVGTPERIRALYPILREINDEIDEIHEEAERMQPIYEMCDKIVDAFADIIDSRDAMPPDLHAQVCRLLVGWVGEVDFRLSGEELKEHSLRPTLGDAVCEHMLKMAA